MYTSTRRGFLQCVVAGIGMGAGAALFASELDVEEAAVDIVLSARTVGNLILKTGGPVNFTWRGQDGRIIAEISNIRLESSINAGLDQNADVRVAFAYRAVWTSISDGAGVDYEFRSGDKSLVRGALHTKSRVGAARWTRHDCQANHEVAAPRLPVPRASFLQADVFRFILNADRFATC